MKSFFEFALSYDCTINSTLASDVDVAIDDGKLVLLSFNERKVVSTNIIDVVDCVYSRDGSNFPVDMRSLSSMSLNTGVSKDDVLKWIVLSLRLSLLSLLSVEETGLLNLNTSTMDQLLIFQRNADMYLTESVAAIETIIPENIIGPQDSKVRELFLLVTSIAKQTEMLFGVGGDDRLTMGTETKYNKYFGSTMPVVGLVQRGSCTCSTVRREQYTQARNIRDKFLTEIVDLFSEGKCKIDDLSVKIEKIKSIFDSMSQTIISSLSTVLNKPGEVVLFPSGSDAELLPLLMALIRGHTLKNESQKAKVLNFVTAAGEVGSGTPNASNGKHFSPFAPRGCTHENNGYLDGIDSSTIDIFQFKPRDENGKINFMEEKLIADVSTKLAENPSGVAIIHIVCGSKTGLIYPSVGVCEQLRQKFGSDRVIVVVDACQLRCKLHYVKKYSDMGYFTLITGSKFFGGPPFSGAVIMPNNFVEEMEKHLSERPTNSMFFGGLSEYLTKYEVPHSLPNLRKHLDKGIGNTLVSKSWINFGLHLRWACAVKTIEDYSKVPSSLIEEFTVAWVARVKNLVTTIGAPFLCLLEDDNNGMGRGIEEEMSGGVNPIVSIGIKVYDKSTNSMRFLNVDECKIFHRLMSAKLSKFQKDEVVYKFSIGQPVKLASNGFAIIRIALGAQTVIETVAKQYRLDDISTPVMPTFLNTDEEDRNIVMKMLDLAKLWGTETASIRYVLAENKLLLNSVPFMKSNDAFTTEEVVCNALQKIFPFGNMPKSAVIYDLDAMNATVESLHQSFGSTSILSLPPLNTTFLNCFAVKACPVSFVLQFYISKGLGLETASLGEVMLALRAGCPPSKIIFDSPCKTFEDIYFAIKTGVQVNANSWAEITKIQKVIDKLKKEIPSFNLQKNKNIIGVRVNPMTGSGSIAELSTATVLSKFGIPLRKGEGETAIDETESIVNLFKENKWLNGVMCHVGSQGMTVSNLAEGAKRIIELANTLNSSLNEERIVCIDIGGGLSANFQSNDALPSFAEYASELAPAFGKLPKDVTIITEFGKALIAKCGVIITEIEDIIDVPVSALKGEREIEATAITHVGADVMLRAAYCPEKFQCHRLSLLDKMFNPLKIAKAKEEPNENEREDALMTIAGPLCFSGDVLYKKINIPKPQIGEYCLIADAGANTLSLFSKHCSRISPVVYGFRKAVIDKETKQETILSAIIRESETAEDMMKFWD